MYIVKITIKPSNPNNSRERYKKKFYEGIYLPKNDGSKVRHDKIKQKIESEIIANIKTSNPKLKFEYSAKIEHNSMDFVFKECESTFNDSAKTTKN